MKVVVKTDCDEVVTLAEAKNFMKVTGTQDDDLIEDILIPSARQSLEKYTGASFGEKTLEVLFKKWDKVYNLPYGPVIEVEKVDRVYADGNDITLDEGDYTVSDDKLYVNPWYSTREVVGVRVTYTAGYNDDDPLPFPLKEACLKMILTSYEMRENINVGNITTALDNNAFNIARPYKRFWL